MVKRGGLAFYPSTPYNQRRSQAERMVQPGLHIKIMVAAHKPYWMPADPLYLPVQVGSAGRKALGWQRDDQGDSISEKNETFCELTGLYWMWRNVEADAYGLCHYRRYFAKGLPLGNKRERILTSAQAEALMQGTDMVLPRKRHYVIETTYTQYIHAHHKEDLALTRTILQEKYPSFLPAWEQVMAQRSGHRFNMLLMKKPLFEDYCHWLFDILLELERRLDICSYSPSDRRVFGYVGERLLDCWVTERGHAYQEVRVVNLESQHWGRKILRFIQRKLVGAGRNKAHSHVGF